MARPSLDLKVTSGDVARAMKWSSRTAHRRMLAIHQKSPTVVWRDGRALISTEKLLEPHIPGLRVLLPVEHEVRRLRERVGDLETRLDREVEARKAFQEQAHQWFGQKRGPRKP